MQEIWKSIEGYEGLYEVSNYGRIRSYHNNKHGLREIPKIIIGLDSTYKTIALSKDGKKESRTIHSLVAETFLDNPNQLKEVNHKDGNKWNNRVDNLEWITHADNMKHASTHHLFGQCKKVYCIEDDKTYDSITEFGKHIGVRQPRASIIANKVHKYKGKTYILKEV